jgi:hypothetical protein
LAPPVPNTLQMITYPQTEPHHWGPCHNVSTAPPQTAQCTSSDTTEDIVDQAFKSNVMMNLFAG